MSTFQTALRRFASSHRSKILSDPIFRQHFSQMCTQLGVDPLGGGPKGGKLWDWLGVSDWTYTLAVQVVDVCISSRDTNGGLIEMSQLVKGVSKLRTGSHSDLEGSQHTPITAADIIQAVKSLNPLACGYDVFTLPGNIQMVRSLPKALDSDSLLVLEAASALNQPFITSLSFSRYAAEHKGWKHQRAEAALTKALVEDGLVWEDEQAPEAAHYWITSLVAF